MIFLSNDGFLSNGVIRAAFIFVGTIPVDMDSLTMFVMLGRMQSIFVPLASMLAQDQATLKDSWRQSISPHLPLQARTCRV